MTARKDAADAGADQARERPGDRPGQLTVRVPATAANLGPGFDACGLALDWYDEVHVSLASDGIELSLTGEGADELPRDATHLVMRSLIAGLEALQAPRPGIGLRSHNTIPHGRGLGSSAAAIVAGLALAHGIARPGAALSREWLLTQAARIEGHADNVAACIHGGFSIAWQDSEPRAVAVRPHPDLAVLALIPERRLVTSHARGLLPGMVRHADAAATAGRAALLTHAITCAPELLLPATRDWLHQAARRSALGATADLIDALRAEGHAAVVSGAGPSALVMGPRSAIAELATRRFDGHRCVLHGVGEGVVLQGCAG